MWTLERVSLMSVRVWVCVYWLEKREKEDTVARSTRETITSLTTITATTISTNNIYNVHTRYILIDTSYCNFQLTASFDYQFEVYSGFNFNK